MEYGSLVFKTDYCFNFLTLILYLTFRLSILCERTIFKIELTEFERRRAQ